MTIGDKIKKIRTFRNMTQAELGAALGWGDKGANSLAQYETNYREMCIRDRDATDAISDYLRKRTELMY